MGVGAGDDLHGQLGPALARVVAHQVATAALVVGHRAELVRRDLDADAPQAAVEAFAAVGPDRAAVALGIVFGVHIPGAADLAVCAGLHQGHAAGLIVAPHHADRLAAAATGVTHFTHQHFALALPPEFHRDLAVEGAAEHLGRLVVGALEVRILLPLTVDQGADADVEVIPRHEGLLLGRVVKCFRALFDHHRQVVVHLPTGVLVPAAAAFGPGVQASALPIGLEHAQLPVAGQVGKCLAQLQAPGGRVEQVDIVGRPAVTAFAAIAQGQVLLAVKVEIVEEQHALVAVHRRLARGQAAVGLEGGIGLGRDQGLQQFAAGLVTQADGGGGRVVAGGRCLGKSQLDGVFLRRVREAVHQRLGSGRSGQEQAGKHQHRADQHGTRHPCKTIRGAQFNGKPGSPTRLRKSKPISFAGQAGFLL